MARGPLVVAHPPPSPAASAWPPPPCQRCATADDGEAPPSGLPPAASGPIAWNCASLPQPADFTCCLTAAQVAELEHALAFFHGLGLDGDCVDRTNFPLPTVGPQLRQLAVDLHAGRGFFVVRGLDPARYSAEDNAVLLLGIASYVGDERGCQDHRGNVLTHVYNHPDSLVPHEQRRPSETDDDMTFHNDQLCEILALHARQLPASGGETVLASAAAVYNELITERPDIVRLACQPDWPYHSPNHDPACTLHPLLFHEDDRLILNLCPDRLRPPQSYLVASGLPSLTPAQHAALNAINAIATKHQLTISLQPGDILFCNNLALLHSRRPYFDTPNHRRHLVRLWLRNSSLGWPIPDALQPEWEHTYRDIPYERLYQVVPLPVVLTPIYRFPSY